MWKRVSWLPLVLAHPCFGQTYESNLPIGHPAIRYSDASLDDPVTSLAKAVESGQIGLNFGAGPTQGLADLLDRLRINFDSQALVFSKTSFQASKISPHNPRAIYFGDDAAVGFVRGGQQLELAGLDSRQGVVFYSLDVKDPVKPIFTRSEVCLRCHQGPATSGVPGMFISSVYPSSSGFPSPIGAIVTDHRTPLEDRWGGWFVSGTLADKHRGNAVASNPDAPEILDRDIFDADEGAAGVSDVVALMTFEHQTQMTNLLTRIGWEARIAEEEGKADEFVRIKLDAHVEQIVEYMLFADEAPLKGPVKGVSRFTQTFPLRGPRDKKGRSLRDFDLEKRLFRYPLSYMVYSRAFDRLPRVVRGPIYRRLYGILTSSRSGPAFGLSPEQQRAIVEILRETKPNLPDYWRIPVN
jgi:hypothetical protein